ncbi:hypothetical protein BDW69DRAFT_165688 [Aspergillus filifer]
MKTKTCRASTAKQNTENRPNQCKQKPKTTSSYLHQGQSHQRPQETKKTKKRREVKVKERIKEKKRRDTQTNLKHHQDHRRRSVCRLKRDQTRRKIQLWQSSLPIQHPLFLILFFTFFCSFLFDSCISPLLPLRLSLEAQYVDSFADLKP